MSMVLRLVGAKVPSHQALFWWVGVEIKTELFPHSKQLAALSVFDPCLPLLSGSLLLSPGTWEQLTNEDVQIFINLCIM